MRKLRSFQHLLMADSCPHKQHGALKDQTKRLRRFRKVEELGMSKVQSRQA